jgi:hypothetical protein
MPRDLTPALRRVAYARERSHVLVTLMTIFHPQLPQPIRVCNQSEAVVSRGTTFAAWPSARPELPGDREDELPESSLELGVVHQDIIRAIAQVFEPEPILLMELVLHTSPSTVALSAKWKIPSTRWTRFIQTSPLTLRNHLTEPCSKERITPGNFPGGF